MHDEQLLKTVYNWNQTWGAISWDWLKRCQQNMDRYFCLDDDQRDGLNAIIKNNEINPLDMRDDDCK